LLLTIFSPVGIPGRQCWRFCYALLSIEDFDFEVEEPDRSRFCAMEPLQADGPAARIISQGNREFIARPIRIFVGLLPVVQVEVEHLFAVKDQRQPAIATGDGITIPVGIIKLMTVQQSRPNRTV